MKSFLLKAVRKSGLDRVVRKMFFRRRVPIYLFLHHKTGTNLLIKVFKEICAHEHWRFEYVLRKPDFIPDADVVLFGRANVIDPARIKHPYIGVHMIRDPREVVVSGYFYHIKTTESWCVGKEDREGSPIPQSRWHDSGEWKQAYLDRLGGKSYQEKLNELSEEEGIEFEMRNHSSWVIRDMLDWDYGNSRILEVKLEEVSADFCTAFGRIFDHLGISARTQAVYQRLAARHDLNRLKDSELEQMGHVRTKAHCTWPDHLTPQHLKLFYQLFGEDCCKKLGYDEAFVTNNL